MLNPYLLVALGGALGSVARFGISNVLKVEGEFPWPTFLVNFIGSALIGYLIAYTKMSSNEFWNNNIMYFGIVGFCGGFTTFATFSKELFYLLDKQLIALFLLYSISSLIVGVLAFSLTYFLVLKLFS